MVKLTVPFETGFQAATERKETNYKNLVNRARQTAHNTHFITVEVGAQGVPGRLQQTHCSPADVESMMLLKKEAIEGVSE